jgi:peroxiredoxin
MAQLRQEYQKFTDRDAEVIAVGPEDAKSFSKFWRAEKMLFTGIPDPKHIIADLYGQEVNPFRLGRMPALFVIDKDGRVRYSHYGKAMSDIPPNADILSLLEKLNREK